MLKKIDNPYYHNDYLTVSLACGGSASQNQSYLVQTSVTTLTSPCSYTICPCSSNICRIRFDFTVRNLKNKKQKNLIVHDWESKLKLRSLGFFGHASWIQLLAFTAGFHVSVTIENFRNLQYKNFVHLINHK